MKIYNIIILLFLSFIFSTKTYSSENNKEFFKLFPVGKVEKKGDSTVVRIFDSYSEALKGLDDFSHVIVVYWFHKNDTPIERSVLQIHPRSNSKNPMTGIFACRSPLRPNLIALSVCKIISIIGNSIYIERIDAFDGSPVIDLKPYIPSIDKPKGNISLPDWLNN